jgi:hypothetical protein
MVYNGKNMDSAILRYPLPDELSWLPEVFISQFMRVTAARDSGEPSHALYFFNL